MNAPVMTEYRCPKCNRLLFIGTFVGWIETLCPVCPKDDRRRTFREDAKHP